MIKASNLTFMAGNRSLLKGIDIDVKPGEMLTIIGANGAGKSTLLKLLCGEHKAFSGSITFNGKNINHIPASELAKMRAVLSQHNTVSVSFMVKELVLMGRYPHFDIKPSPHDMDIVNLVMQETGITHLAGRDYNTLSGGEQQRVQLARVIAQIWDVPGGFLFLDEPTNGLDLLYQQQLLNTVRKLADRGYAIISILHDINFASQYADKILILKNGSAVALGTPAQVINCENIHEAFSIKVRLMECEDFKCPLVIPSGLLA